jgi:predicted TIM-barrel fold metal-dependent hydrolase
VDHTTDARPIPGAQDLRAAGCAVRVEPYDEHASLVTVDGARGDRVLLEGPGWRRTRLMDLVTGRRIDWRDGQAMIDIPEHRAAWLMVFRPPPEISVFDYDPECLLELPSTAPARARFPVIDVHAHLTMSGQSAAERLRLMDELGIQTVVSSAFADRQESTEATVEGFARHAPTRLRTAATLDWSLVREPGGVASLVETVTADVRERGAVLVGEMHEKGFGVDDLGAGPVRPDPVFVDDRRLDPLWETLAGLRVPVLMHCGDDLAVYQPWDARNESVRQLFRSPWSRRRAGGLSQEQVRRRRDEVLARFPGLTVIAAHLDGSGERLDALAQRLSVRQNLYVELGARHHVLARQPRQAARFLRAWGHRTLFGGDRAQDRQTYLDQFRILESDDDAFRTRDHAEPWPLYGLALPDDVLAQVYLRTAQEVLPAVASGGGPRRATTATEPAC